VIHYPWVWPASETLHFIGLALLVGIVGTIDLRMLGMAKNMPFRPLHRLLPWAIAGFGINLITGILFFAGDPFQYIHNLAFQLKLLFILLAGLNVLVFYLTTFKPIQDLEPGEDAALRAKVVAVTSGPSAVHSRCPQQSTGTKSLRNTKTGA
jgi:hypothetical protein